MASNGVHGLASVHLIGVSIPRSGHNFVVRILQALYPLDLFYCEFYDVRGCCQSFPCARRGTLPITFQKTHDFGIDVPTDVPGATYVILHRAPVPAALSARELYAGDYGDEIGADRGEYAVWLGRTAEYYVSFVERWIDQPPPRSVLIDYDALAADPATTVRQVVEAAGLAADETAIGAAVQKTVPYGGLFGERAYVPRSIEKSKYLDRELLAAYESIIVDHVPRLADGRALDPIAYRDTLTWRVFEALRTHRAGDTEAAIDLLDRAIETAPDNALLYYERAALLQVQRRFAEAHDALRRATALLPTHRPILEAGVTVALAAGDPTAVVEPMEQLDAISKPTLLGRLRLALIRVHGGDETAAEAVLAEVERDQPDDADAWRIVSELRYLRLEMDQALAAIETAIRLAPLNGELYAYRGKLLFALDRPDAAIETLDAALVIGRRQGDWWALLVDAYQQAGDTAGALAALDEALEQLPDDAELRARRDSLRKDAPDAPEPAAGQRRDRVARLEIELTQVRAALGVAERRLYEVEVRKQQQLEESWDQTHKLDDALQEKDEAMRTAWARARALTADLKAMEQQMQAAWNQANTLDAALQEKERAMQEAWTHARALTATLEEKEEALREAWAHAHRLDEALEKRHRDLDAAWARAAALEESRQRLHKALAEASGDQR